MNTISPENYEDRLTPAARKALEDLLEDYKMQVLFGAIKSASSVSGNIEEISVRDIYSGMNAAFPKESTVLTTKQRKTKQVLWIGIVYTIIGFVVGIAINLFSNSWVEGLDLPITILFTGIGIAGIVLTVISYLRTRQYERQFLFQGNAVTAEFELIQAWRDIEIVSKKIIASYAGESKAERPLSQLIQDLRKTKIVSREEENKMLELLQLRNQLVHNVSSHNYDDPMLKVYVGEANKLLGKLQRILNEEQERS